MGMGKVNIHYAKTHLSELIGLVLSGDDIIIAKAGKPLVKMIPINPLKSEPRKLGGLAGKITIASNFDDEDDEINHLFYGKTSS